jgi:multiple sugar transport system substrate-binding protein
LYALHGGQPAHRDAWDDDRVNECSNDFYRNTRATLDASYVRPRFDGYIAFQEVAGKLVVRAIRRELSIPSAIAQLNQLFVEAQPNA